ncbi:MAG: lysophospholipid acyltransferase family protein [Sulfitobacter sp.]
MKPTWEGGEPIKNKSFGITGWVLVLIRGLAVGALVFGGLIILLFLRLIEVPFFGLHRPFTPYLTQIVCRNSLRLIGITYLRQGSPMTQHGIVVANHSSWLDIFVLNAAKRVYFVSKSEVARWPGIGWLARATGTVFIERDRKHARAQAEVFQTRLLVGHKLLFFPEGTSTDGLRVLPFKSTLFAAIFTENLRDRIWVQPVTVNYRSPKGCDAQFYGWWGDMSFGSHLLATLATARQGAVEVIYHAPVQVGQFADRKALAAHVENAVRLAHAQTQAGLGL